METEIVTHTCYHWDGLLHGPRLDQRRVLEGERRLYGHAPLQRLGRRRRVRDPARLHRRAAALRLLRLRVARLPPVAVAGEGGRGGDGGRLRGRRRGGGCRRGCLAADLNGQRVGVGVGGRGQAALDPRRGRVGALRREGLLLLQWRERRRR